MAQRTLKWESYDLSHERFKDSQYYKNLLSSSVCLGAMNIGAGFLSSISITLVNETVKNGSQIAFSVFGTSLAMSTEALYDLGSYYIPKLISNL